MSVRPVNIAPKISVIISNISDLKPLSWSFFFDKVIIFLKWPKTFICKISENNSQLVKYYITFHLSYVDKRLYLV